MYAVDTLRYSSEVFSEQILVEGDLLTFEYPNTLYISVVSGEGEE
jgi:hypothetical protein